MHREDRDNFLRNLAEIVQEANSIFDDHGIEAPSIDCEEEDCELPDDNDLITLRNLFVEVNSILEDYIN